MEQVMARLFSWFGNSSEPTVPAIPSPDLDPVPDPDPNPIIASPRPSLFEALVASRQTSAPSWPPSEVHLPSSLPRDSVVPHIPSQIISRFPHIFAPFVGKQFTLLYRGSRDGFTAANFHSKCDHHSNTLTVIRDAQGYILGGYTAAEWDSRPWNGRYFEGNNTFQSDPTRSTFLFTLRNPTGTEPLAFPMNPYFEDCAIACDSDWGPIFGQDLFVCDNCQRRNGSTTKEFGTVFNNSTGCSGNTFFTGATHFRVSEIEIFEVWDEIL